MYYGVLDEYNNEVRVAKYYRNNTYEELIARILRMVSKGLDFENLHEDRKPSTYVIQVHTEFKDLKDLLTNYPELFI